MVTHKCKGADMFFNTSNTNLRLLKDCVKGMLPKTTMPKINSIKYDTAGKRITFYWDEVEWSTKQAVDGLADLRQLGESFNRVLKLDHNIDAGFNGSEFYMQFIDKDAFINDMTKLYGKSDSTNTML